MDSWIFDVSKPDFAYLYGFLQTDGSGYLRKDRTDTGKITIEISEKDAEILEKFQKMIPFYSKLSRRERSTNFKEDAESAILAIHAKEFRHALVKVGFTYGKKHQTIEPPNVEFSELDFVRGLIDGDGSVGVASTVDRPFVSLNTSSDAMARYYLEFIERTIGLKKRARRNNRDNTYNIVVFDEACQLLLEKVYYQDCLALPRKLASAKQALGWKRTKKKRAIFSWWTGEQDSFILAHTIPESMQKLQRTEKSIKTRLWRLKKEK